MLLQSGTISRFKVNTMNRKLIISILALILVVMMVLSLVVSVIPIASGTVGVVHESNALNTLVYTVSEYAS